MKVRWKARSVEATDRATMQMMLMNSVLKVSGRHLSSSFKGADWVGWARLAGPLLGPLSEHLRERFQYQGHKPTEWSVKTGNLPHKLSLGCISLKVTTLGSNTLPSAPISERRSPVYIGDGGYIEFIKTKSTPESLKKGGTIQNEKSAFSLLSLHLTLLTVGISEVGQLAGGDF